MIERTCILGSQDRTAPHVRERESFSQSHTPLSPHWSQLSAPWTVVRLHWRAPLEIYCTGEWRAHHHRRHHLKSTPRKDSCWVAASLPLLFCCGRLFFDSSTRPAHLSYHLTLRHSAAAGSRLEGIRASASGCSAPASHQQQALSEPVDRGHGRIREPAHTLRRYNTIIGRRVERTLFTAIFAPDVTVVGYGGQ